MILIVLLINFKRDYLETYKRCHKSCIANISQIKDVEPVSGVITFNDGSTCDIGPKYKADLMEVLKTYGNFE